MEEISYIYQNKEGKKYVTTFTSADPLYIYERLAGELISKKINECRWIHSIKRKPLYNGFQEITITYDHGGRSVYVVKD